jgi:hypothetical protein
LTTELITRARAGDSEAFRELTGPYRRELQVHCCRILGSFQTRRTPYRKRCWPHGRASEDLRDALRSAPGSTGSPPTGASTCVARPADDPPRSGTCPRLNRPSRPGLAKSYGSSIADRVRLHAAENLRRDPERIAAQAAAHVASQTPAWWLHIDLDVLDGHEFRACGAATDPLMPEGLSWSELTSITRTALQTDGCRGWSITVYNPDLDADGREAERIIAYMAEAIGPRSLTSAKARNRETTHE